MRSRFSRWFHRNWGLRTEPWGGQNLADRSLVRWGQGALLTGLVLALMVAGCRPATPMRTTIRLGYIPIVDLSGLYLAIDRGYFTAENLDIELTAMAGGATILPAVASGSLDIGFSNVLSVILARAEGFDFVIIAHVENEDTQSRTHMVIVKGDSPIQVPKDLEGRRVAVNTFNNIEHLMTQKWLAEKGADLARVTFTELPFPEMPPALMQNQVDAIVTSEPYGTIALSQGGRVLGYEYAETVPDAAVASFVATERWVRANPDVVRRFVRAYQKGAQEAAADPSLQRSVIPKFTRVAPDLAGQMRLVTLRSTIDPAQLQWWADEALAFGLLKKPLDTRVLIYETAK
ncbi:MAG: ABC transporter substrate-binding protein [Anaerolineae bacterium]